MRITQEADYAVRIIDCLSRAENRLDAGKISEETGVTPRFTLKILRKLVVSGTVKSYKGVHGGYELSRSSALINMREVIEAVDGPISINKCLTENMVCCKNDENKDICYYQNIFAQITKMVRDKLNEVTFDTKEHKKS